MSNRVVRHMLCSHLVSNRVVGHVSNIIIGNLSYGISLDTCPTKASDTCLTKLSDTVGHRKTPSDTCPTTLLDMCPIGHWGQTFPFYPLVEIVLTTINTWSNVYSQKIIYEWLKYNILTLLTTYFTNITAITHPNFFDLVMPLNLINCPKSVVVFSFDALWVQSYVAKRLSISTHPLTGYFQFFKPRFTGLKGFRCVEIDSPWQQSWTIGPLPLYRQEIIFHSVNPENCYKRENLLSVH